MKNSENEIFMCNLENMMCPSQKFHNQLEITYWRGMKIKKSSVSRVACLLQKDSKNKQGQTDFLYEIIKET